MFNMTSVYSVDKGFQLPDKHWPDAQPLAFANPFDPNNEGAVSSPDYSPEVLFSPQGSLMTRPADA